MAGLVQTATNTSTPSGDSAPSNYYQSGVDLNADAAKYKSWIDGFGWTGDAAKSAITNSQNHYAQNPSIATASTYSPTNWSVDDNQLVEKRLNNLTDPNSPLNQQAATQAAQTAQSRGLINSSLAVTAGQDAVLKNAIPIATADAGTYANSARYNADAANTSNQFNTNATNVLANANADRSNAMSLATLNSETQKFLGGLTSNTQLALGNLDAATKSNLQNVVSHNSQLLQTNTSASNLAAQYMTAIANIQSSTTMDAAAKQQAVNNQLAIMQQSLSVIGNIAGLDLSQYFQSAADASAPVTTGSTATTDTGNNGTYYDGSSSYNG